LIKVKIGKFHQIVPEVMQTYFKLMKKEYPGFNEAELILEEIDLKLRCKKCQHSYLLQEPLFICDQCGSWETELISGDELYIETIEGWQEDLDNSLTGEDQ
ncbi:MAG: hydrogenase maturation nickel metallochaperone HypA, partial [Candidatus Cloacimonetes bacterium]|nr:hydrogenase maturation nickel metallochaperone HypA [Candidatus Cloacimonadota bacterium]